MKTRKPRSKIIGKLKISGNVVMEDWVNIQYRPVPYIVQEISIAKKELIKVASRLIAWACWLEEQEKR